MEFAQNLRKIMNEKKITNYRLAKTLGVHPTTIKNWLESYTEPKFEMIDRIAEVLGVSIVQLCGATHSFELINQEAIDKMSMSAQDMVDMGVLVREEIREVFFVDTKYILHYFNQLNDEGKIEATKYVERLTRLEEYKKTVENSDKESQRKEKPAD